MKVLYVAASLADEWGGPVTVLRHLVPSMVTLGVKPFVIAPTGYRVGNGTPWNAISTHLGKTSPLARIWIGHARNLISAMDRMVQRADLVHIHELWHYPHWLAYRTARHYGVPYIVTPHGELDAWSLQQKKWKKAAYLRLIQKKILRRAAGIHAITDVEVDEIRLQAANAPVRVIPNGVDLEAFENLPPRRMIEDQYPQLKGKKVILFLGRLHKVKGLDLLANAFATIAEGRNDVALLIAGPDEGYQPRVEQILSSSGGRSKTVFTGMITGQKKLAALASADVFVLPSYGEGFSATVLEAMACGLPLVVSEQCKFPEVGTAQAGIIVKTDVQEVATALGYLIDHCEQGRRMGERGRNMVQDRYSWQSVTRKMFDFYREVAAIKRPGTSARCRTSV